MTTPFEILLVEDNEGDVEMVLDALQSEPLGYNISVANNGREALDTLFKHGAFQDAPTPQLILLDLNMPQVDGKILLKLIKQEERLLTIPVVVLTSSNAPSDIREVYTCHANCYVIKPFDGKEFKHAIKQLVGFWHGLVKLPDQTFVR